MEVENQEGQGPLWAVVPLMMMNHSDLENEMSYPDIYLMD
jgi:hypothetical protein